MTDFLAVDTSSKYLTVLARKGGRTVARHTEDCAMRHSVILMDEIDLAMEQAGLTPEECAFFAAVTGPGSFTGIRIGLSTVKGLALAAGKPVVGVTSFDLIAYNVKGGAPFGVVIDAMRGNFYFAAYDACGVQNVAPRCVAAAEVAACGLPLYGFEELAFENYTKLNAGDCLPAAVEAAARGGFGGLHALYVRKSQAEENAG